MNTSTQMVASRMKTHLRGEGRRGTWDEKGLGQAGPSEQGWVQRSCLINSKPTDGHRASVSDDEQVLEMAVVIMYGSIEYVLCATELHTYKWRGC